MTPERFKEFWDESASGCWIWNRYLNENGYGRTNLSLKGPTLYAHRISWMLHKGDIADGFYVLHKCDTPACVNPDHLYLGTQKENMGDMQKRGRSKKGRFKLTPEQIEEIKLSTDSYSVLAKKYGVGAMTVWHHKNGTYVR